MKAAIYMATYNKNDCLSNTLYSIARQKVPFPYEVCIIDDHSDIDPEPIIKKIIPDAKYKRFSSQQGFDVVTKHVLDLVSDDVDIMIMQSSDVMHYGLDTIERLCTGVSKKIICMATVRNTDPSHDAYKNFEVQLPKIFDQYNHGAFRSAPGKNYFFLGSIRREDYESLGCVTKPYCDIMLERDLAAGKFKFSHPEGIVGFHQAHICTTIPCTRLDTCNIVTCNLRDRCRALGWNKLEDYLECKNRN